MHFYIATVSTLAKGAGLFLLGVFAAQLIESLTGFGANLFHTRRSVRNPARRLWRIKNPESIVVVVSNSGQVSGGNNVLKPTTGVGQLRAVGWLSQSLAKAYKDFDLGHVRLSDEALSYDIHHDLVIVGGRRNNNYAASARETLDAKWEGVPKIEIDIVNGTEFARVVIPDESVDGTSRTIRPEYEDDPSSESANRVRKDIGVIFRAPNPHNESSTVVILAGAHSPGTEAAAKYFVQNMVGHKSLIDAEAFSCVIEVELHHGTSSAPRVVYERVLRRREQNGVS